MKFPPLPSLPPPALDALAASAALVERIAGEIRKADGWITFARYMEMALYEPRLGYYSGGAAKLGPAGDFTTAPEMSPLFGRALARPVAHILQASAPHVLEFGAGSGRLAVDLLSALDALGAAPERYVILELSGELRARQQATLETLAPQWLDRVQWLERMPEAWSGAMLGNEVLDAMPVHLIVKDENGWLERGVVLDARTGFSFGDRPVDASLLESIARAIPDSAALPSGYVTEISLAVPAFIATVADTLHKGTGGAALFIDYGFPEREYYHPQRATGTLMAHYRHHAHADPFRWPGLQDLTAHVDFSAVASAALLHGCDLLGYTSQAAFLLDCGILELVEGSPDDATIWLPQTNALQKLISEAEMGELFKAIAFGKGRADGLPGSPGLPGFKPGGRGDRRAAL